MALAHLAPVVVALTFCAPLRTVSTQVAQGCHNSHAHYLIAALSMKPSSRKQA